MTRKWIPIVCEIIRSFGEMSRTTANPSAA